MVGGGLKLDLEEFTRKLYSTGVPKDKILEELSQLTGSNAKAKAILTEIMNTENISNNFVREISNFKSSGYSADQTGLGCRGEGDFFIHRKMAEIVENRDSVIDARDQDDAGVVKVGDNLIIVSVDGMHSRLSHFPFIAGFHVARATIRDTLVMGSEPKALFSDIHLANDGDVAKIFDYTAGIAVISELCDIPLISGSTLRIGGDLVLGDRLTGCVGCVGFGRKLTPRRDIQPGDILIMTEGTGGGTIATTALYNGYSEIVPETLNLKTITFCQKLINSDLLSHIHAMTDVTNGGIRGDAFELAKTAKVQITLFESKFRKLINSEVLDMLTKLNIDPMGVSIDSLLLILPEEYVDEILEFIHKNGLNGDIVGRVEEFTNENSLRDQDKSESDFGVKLIRESDNLSVDLKPHYREEPYTPIKKVVNVMPNNQKDIQRAIDEAMKSSKKKKEELKSWMFSEGRV